MFPYFYSTLLRLYSIFSPTVTHVSFSPTRIALILLCFYTTVKRTLLLQFIYTTFFNIVPSYIVRCYQTNVEHLTTLLLIFPMKRLWPEAFEDMMI